MEKKGNHDEHTLNPAFNDLLYAVDAFNCGSPLKIVNSEHNMLTGFADLKAPRLQEFQMAPAPLVYLAP